MSAGPLAGIRVLDLTNVLAGPYCSYQLMLLGAEVVKLEIPGLGDLARQLGPGLALNAVGLGASFLAQNAGKKSVEVDLKTVEGKSLFESMVESADVLLENFRPGVLARLGFSADRLLALNEKLVYCAISGFGQTGPMSPRPAYDQIVQGLSGMMTITGTADTTPQRVGFPICDTVGGLMAAVTINAALVRREKTGRGTVLDVSMLEASLSVMGWAVSNYLVSGIEPRAMGDQNATAAPSGAFETADGPINIAANRQEQFESLCHVVGLDQLITDPRYATREARKDNRSALNEMLNVSLRGRSALDWENELASVGVPASRILTVAQAVEQEQLAWREFFCDLPFPDGSDRTFRVNGNGVLIDGAASHPPTPAPLLGQHNDEFASPGAVAAGPTNDEQIAAS